MALPTLIDGGVLPAGIHDMTGDQVREIFVSSKAREDLWNRFNSFLERLKETVPVPVSVYLDGSFISDWDTCCDIDVVIEAREFEGGHTDVLKMLTSEQVREEFLEDFKVLIHTFVPGLFGRNYCSWFQRVKSSDCWRFGGDSERLRKGIVRLAI